ncbi:hypothetical protein, partial [Ruminococcus sp.]|uniref:hypothetical protein n=1 Tax=Ruminococcus sp. TaxID=41978 RepID=UPI003FD8CE25
MEVNSLSKVGVNYGLAECQSSIEIQLTLNYPPKSKKVYSIFQKLRVGAAPIIFSYITIYWAQTAWL